MVMQSLRLQRVSGVGNRKFAGSVRMLKASCLIGGVLCQSLRFKANSASTCRLQTDPRWTSRYQLMIVVLAPTASLPAPLDDWSIQAYKPLSLVALVLLLVLH